MSPKAEPREDQEDPEAAAARVEADVERVLTKIGDVLEQQ